MIADTAVTMGSLWLSDSHESDDPSGTDARSMTSLGLSSNTFEEEISRLHRQPNSEMTSDMYSLLSSVSCDASVASSECSDDLCVDVDGDDGLFCDLQASILTLLDENPDSNVLCLNNIDLADGEWSSLSSDIDNQSTTSGYSTASSNSDISCSSYNSIGSSPYSKHCLSNKQSNSRKNGTKHKNTSSDNNLSKSAYTDRHQCSAEQESYSAQNGRKRQNSQNTDGKKWSHLSSTEQVAVVEELSQVISTELGLREQLDVIRIIKPGAKISPTDREFVIDLEGLDDDKLERIQEYIKLHVGSAQDQPIESPNSLQKKTSKRQKCQERRSQQKVIRQRQRKEYRQMMKERRSGLFVKEEVLALSTTDPGEEDIEILM